MTPFPALSDSVPQHGRCDAAIPAQPGFSMASQAGCALFVPFRGEKVIYCRHALFAWNAGALARSYPLAGMECGKTCGYAHAAAWRYVPASCIREPYEATTPRVQRRAQRRARRPHASAGADVAAPAAAALCAAARPASRLPDGAAATARAAAQAATRGTPWGHVRGPAPGPAARQRARQRPAAAGGGGAAALPLRFLIGRNWIRRPCPAAS